MKFIYFLFSCLFIIGCNATPDTAVLQHDSLLIGSPTMVDTLRSHDTLVAEIIAGNDIDTHGTSPDSLIAFAKKWLHVNYLYASSDPAKGFDCSGFINYVFNHFHIDVPRSSINFTNRGRPIPLIHARKADLILFTGTDSSIREVGHMGIVLENTDSLRFIHASSGKANGVTITALNKYYMGRFVSIRRIFPE